MIRRARRYIAPRLANGDSRLPFGHGLPDVVKDAFRMVAEDEQVSMSWLAEEMIVAFLAKKLRFTKGKRRFIKPIYVQRKKERAA